MNSLPVYLILTLIWAVPQLAWGQTDLRARELFYSPGPPTPAAPTKAAARKSTPAAQSKPAKRANDIAPQTAKAAPTSGITPSEMPLITPVAGNVPSVSNDLDPKLVTIAHRTGGVAERPLGLRYSILKLTGPAEYRAVDAKSVFHSGDAVRVEIEANDSGYLYVIARGTSGTWKPAFPSQELGAGNNWVEGGRKYTMPPGSQFRFYGQGGEESLFVVLSRQPEPSLEKLIYSLGQGDGPTATPSKEGPRVNEAPRFKVMMASAAPIQDDLVSQLRNTYSRDLEIEKIDETAAPGAAQEAAVYVVNRTGAADSRVVADIKLIHQ